MYKKLFVVSSLLMLAISCTHTEKQGANQLFHAPRDEVWEVLVAVLKSYPLKTIDEQKGYIETEILGADLFWRAPHQKRLDLSGYSSVITVTLDYEKPVTRVFIYKKVYKQRGFISSKEEVPSDLMEENILLYRVARELNVRTRLNQLQ